MSGCYRIYHRFRHKSSRNQNTLYPYIKKTHNFNLKFNSMHVILASINLQLHVPIYCINKNDYAIFSEFCTGVRRTPRVRYRHCSCHTRRSLSATGRRGLWCYPGRWSPLLSGSCRSSDSGEHGPLCGGIPTRRHL